MHKMRSPNRRSISARRFSTSTRAPKLRIKRQVTRMKANLLMHEQLLRTVALT